MVRICVDQGLKVSGIRQFPTLMEAVLQDLTLANPEYQAARRHGYSVWGKPKDIQLYKWRGQTLTLPRGYARTLRYHLGRQQVEASWDNRTCLKDPVAFQSGICLRPYQEGAVTALLQGRQGGVVAPCGSGKTIIMLEAMARIGQPALWVTHTKELLNQTRQRAMECLGLTDEQIGEIAEGKVALGSHLTLALVQTLAKADLQPLEKAFGAVFVDEAHHLAAGSFYRTVGRFAALYRLWASATPQREDGLTPMIVAAGGPVLHVIGRCQTGTLSPQLVVVETEFELADDFMEEDRLQYAKALSYLTANNERNRLIVDTLRREAPGHLSLVLSERKEHLRQLALWLQEALPDLTVEVLTADLKKSQRQEIMERAQARQVDILLATQLAREGLDLTHLDRLFLATPKRAAAAVEQEVGRIMRPSAGKKDAIVFDFWDSRSRLFRSRFWKRRQVYRNIGVR